MKEIHHFIKTILKLWVLLTNNVFVVLLFIMSHITSVESCDVVTLPPAIEYFCFNRNCYLEFEDRKDLAHLIVQMLCSTDIY